VHLPPLGKTLPLPPRTAQVIQLFKRRTESIQNQATERPWAPTGTTGPCSTRLIMRRSIKSQVNARRGGGEGLMGSSCAAGLGQQ
jgi:hypothetical protein